MKVISLILFLVFCCCTGLSQKNWQPSDATPLKIKFSKIQYHNHRKIPFKEILVRDYRFDTTKIGYFKEQAYFKAFIQEGSSNGLTAALNRHYQNILDPQSDRKLLIIINELWLQSGGSEFLEGDKMKTFFNYNYTLKDKIGVAFINVDVFSVEDENCQALHRYKDYFFRYPYQFNQLDELVYMPFDSMMFKIQGIEVDKVLANKKKYAFSTLEENYKKKFDLPVLKTGKTERGVFLTFEDFLQNKTHHKDFVLKRGKLSDEVYDNEHGSLVTDYWGFYDGNDFYINSSFNVFKLFRENNSFCFYGSKYVSFNSKRSGPSIPPQTYEFILHSNKSKVYLRPLQLNMSTGKIY